MPNFRCSIVSIFLWRIRPINHAWSCLKPAATLHEPPRSLLPAFFLFFPWCRANAVLWKYMCVWKLTLTGGYSAAAMEVRLSLQFLIIFVNNFQHFSCITLLVETRDLGTSFSISRVLLMKSGCCVAETFAVHYSDVSVVAMNRSSRIPPDLFVSW